MVLYPRLQGNILYPQTAFDYPDLGRGVNPNIPMRHTYIKCFVQYLILRQPTTMSYVFLAVRANTKRLIPTRGRSFHTPFAILGNSHLKTAPSTNIASQYEKQYDHPPEPITSHSGYRTYVVSEPDTSTKHYRVPAGAYPTYAPYIINVVADKPNTKARQYTAGGEHGFTTRAAASRQGGSYGGTKLEESGNIA